MAKSTSGSSTMRAVFLSMVAIVLSALLLVTGSYALFTDSVSVKNHLQAGTMKVQLWRVELQNTRLDANGVLVQEPADTTAVDFTNETSKNVFGLVTGDTIVPGTQLKAKMELRNANTVAFKYYIEIVPTNVDDATAYDVEFWKQLEVIVEADNTTYTKAVAEDGSLAIGSETNALGPVNAGTANAPTAATFTITVNFNEDAGNEVQDKKVAFDLIVYAVQATA